MNEVEGAKVDSDAAKEFVCTIENIVKDVTLSQSGCEGHEDGLVMIDSGASVNVCPRFGNLFLFNQTDHFDSDVRTEELQGYGKRQLWLIIGHYLRRYDFHVALAQATCSFCVGVFCVPIAMPAISFVSLLFVVLTAAVSSNFLHQSMGADDRSKGEGWQTQKRRGMDGRSSPEGRTSCEGRHH